MPQLPVYLDHAATTPVLPEVREAMLPFLGPEAFGNPSSPHQVGRSVRGSIDVARQRVGVAVGANPATVYFTSGGTEADNLAVLGRALAARAAGEPFRVAVSTIEHKAVLAAAHAVEAMGGEVIALPVDQRGVLDPNALDAALELGVAIVSVMWVNNEVGVMQDVSGIADRCAAVDVPFHTDAVQALGKVAVDLSVLPNTMASVSAHKIGGPKGVGALLLPNPAWVAPMVHGGGQQSGVRPGTENVPGIVGFGRAAALAGERVEVTAEETRTVRNEFEKRLLATIPDAGVTGVPGPRAPHISSVAFPGTMSEPMLMHLDLAGVCCSSGSACTTGAVEPSHVLTAMGLATDVAMSTLRFSFGHGSSLDDVDRVMKVLPGIVKRVRRLGEVLNR